MKYVFDFTKGKPRTTWSVTFKKGSFSISAGEVKEFDTEKVLEGEDKENQIIIDNIDSIVEEAENAKECGLKITIDGEKIKSIKKKGGKNVPS